MKRACIVAAAVLLAAACQTLVEETPTTASQPTAPSTTPVVVTPVAIPSPTSGGGGGGTPTPSPSSPSTTQPPATQPPATQPPAGTQGCGLPPGTGPGNSCPRGSSSFLPQVEAAIDRLVREQPGIFNLNDGGPCGNCYGVRNTGAYEAGVVANLQRAGLCAKFDGEEFAVKNSNNFNDQYDLMTADGHVRRQEGSYRGTCRPAWF
jgi:hypothetical protein